MAKLTKSQNPYGITCRSVWEARQTSRRGRTFTIKRIVGDAGNYFAECLYNKSGKQSRINLQNFGKYKRVV
jgi:hypothetical protein